MNAVAIVPARGGSKRIPKKNIRTFLGRPLISYSLNCLIESNLFEEIIVSTDDEEIAKVAESQGPCRVVQRPKDLADDYATSSEVISHAAKSLGLVDEVICCAYPTAPLMAVADLQSGFDLFASGKWQYVFAATNYRYPVQRSFTRQDGGGLQMLDPAAYLSRSQDLTPVFHDVGWFYWAQASTWRDQSTIFSAQSSFVEIPANRAIDIDTEEDWKMAEAMYTLEKFSSI